MSALMERHGAVSLFRIYLKHLCLFVCFFFVRFYHEYIGWNAKHFELDLQTSIAFKTSTAHLRTAENEQVFHKTEIELKKKINEEFSLQQNYK